MTYQIVHIGKQDAIMISMYEKGKNKLFTNHRIQKKQEISLKLIKKEPIVCKHN